MTLLASSPMAQAQNYCLAIRGNGESEPAHWGAMANVVERLGLPQAMAGGSSATISMFWLESIASHPLIQGQPAAIQKERASLMIKSLLGFLQGVQDSRAWKEFVALYGEYQKSKGLATAEKIRLLASSGQFEAALRALDQGVELGLLDPRALAPLVKALESQDAASARFYVEELAQTVRVFGSFDAATDDNLFFRPGLVSFEKASEAFGRVAGFYAAEDADPATLAKWGAFLETCAPASTGLNWAQILTRSPRCHALFGEVFRTHFDRKGTAGMERKSVGFRIPSFPTTTVLTGPAVQEIENAMREYHRRRDSRFGRDFRLSDPENIRFGYWGAPEALDRIRLELDESDEKSRRFLALGETDWKTVLSLSPAEPGLSPLKIFEAGGERFVSAGGWSDLHPVAVLKAAGCANVVYLTRRGGESIFAQGVAKRLFGFERSWDVLKTTTPEDARRNGEINVRGDSADMTSLWSRLYNMANPQSSIRRSLEKADAVLCTNWNDFDAKKDLPGLVEDSYRSSYVIKSADPALREALEPSISENIPGCR